MRRRELLKAWAASTLLAGCGGVTVPEGEGPGPGAAAEPQKPRDAARIAEQLVGGRVSGLVFVDRMREHPVGPRLLTLGPARELLAGTRVDPLKDLERVFVTGPSANEPRAIMFAEHKIEVIRIPSVIDDLVKKSDPPGEIITGTPYPTVRVSRKGRGGIVAFLPPSFVVVLPEDLAGSVSAFAQTGGLPLPEGIETARVFAADPSTTLRARGVPRIPESIGSIDALLTLRPDGGANLDAVGPSASAAQAADDAAYLTDAFERATSVTLGFVKIRVFRPIEFVPREEKVEAHVDLSRGEIEQLLGLADSFAG